MATRKIWHPQRRCPATRQAVSVSVRSKGDPCPYCADPLGWYSPVEVVPYGTPKWWLRLTESPAFGVLILLGVGAALVLPPIINFTFDIISTESLGLSGTTVRRFGGGSFDLGLVVQVLSSYLLLIPLLVLPLGVWAYRSEGKPVVPGVGTNRP